MVKVSTPTQPSSYLHLTSSGEAVGAVTSVINLEGNTTFQALGYLKSRYANHTASSSFGLTLLASNTQNTFGYVTVLPSAFPEFISSASPAPPVPKLASKGRDILVGVDAAVKSPTKASTAEEERRAAKLRAMAEKVAALQAMKRTAE